MRINRCFSLVLIVLLSLVFSVVLTKGEMSYATTWIGGSGTGVSSGSGHPVKCSDYLNALSIWCVDTDDGGASWHIYSINSLPDQPGGPIYRSEGHKDFLSGSGYSEAELRSECPADTYDYYLAYVFDGRVRNRAYFAQWGPIAPAFAFLNGTEVQRNEFFAGGLAYTGSYDQIVEDMKSGADLNGKRVSWDIATQFYRNFTASNGTIPPSKGFICAKEIDNTVIKGKSNVSLRSNSTSTGLSDWKASGENTINHGTKTARMTNNNVKLCKNDEAYLTFSHSVLSNNENAKANASVEVSLGNLALGYASTITDKGNYPESARMEGSASVEVGNNGYGLHGTYYDLFDGEKRYSDGTHRYFYRDHLKIKFNEAATYSDLCETLSIDGQEVTQACADITVTDDCETDPGEPDIPEIPGECGTIDFNTDPYTSSTSSSGKTIVASKVRNNSVDLWSEWSDQVYAKPTDNPEWLHCYYPGVQLTADAEATDNHDPGSDPGATESTYNPDNDYSLTTSKLKSSIFGTWQNQYTISSSSAPGSSFTTARVPGSTTEYGAIGDASVLSFNDDSYNVAYLREGDTLTETNTSGIPVESSWEEEDSHSWGCKYGVVSEDGDGNKEYGPTETCSHDEKFISHTFNNVPVSDSASVLVPYNFENVTTILTSTDTRVFAGESKEFSFKVATLPRRNNTTDGYYATAVRNASWKLELCYTDLEGNNHCQDTSSKAAGYGGTLNPSGSMSGDDVVGKITVSIPDVPAGSTVCLRSAVYPATSGADTNLDPAGDRQWAYSNQNCYIVAKRPSIEVWGGNVYSSGALRTSTAMKNNVAYYTDYEIEKSSPVRLFGSWVDSGIIASGGVVGFSSGATLGGLDLYSHKFPNPRTGINNNDPLEAESPGGGDDTTSFCKERSPLTFSNDCNAAGSIGSNDLVVGAIQGDKSLVSSKFEYAIEGAALSGDIDLGNASIVADKPKADGVYYYYGGDNDLTLGGYEMNDTLVRVVRTTGSVTISGDLRYGGAYGTFDEMPKLVIYAGGDIKIKCNVGRIDGLLLAEGKVTTCSNADDNLFTAGDEDHDYAHLDQNDVKRAKQLIVNGAIIANLLEPGRTYGAGVGANSIVPAEIISFDPSLYLWNGGSKGTTTSDGGSTGDVVIEGSRALNITYQKELAPRL